MQKALLNGFLLLVVVSTAAAIKCYVCKTAESVGCDDPFDAEAAEAQGHLKECNHELFQGKQSGSIPPQNATFFCRKGHQNVREKKTIYRSCGWEQYYIEGRQCYFTSVQEIKTTQCQCETDGCNSATSLAPAYAVAVVSLLSAAVFARA